MMIYELDDIEKEALLSKVVERARADLNEGRPLTEMRRRSVMRVEYELDQWEWQGTTRSVDIDPEDYAGMSVEEIKRAVYEEIWRDAEQSLHFVYAEDETAREILDAIKSGSEGSEREETDG